MRRKLFLSILLASILVFSLAWAAAPLVGTVAAPEGSKPSKPVSSLDEECIIDFVGYTYGTYSGTTTWPGSSGLYLLTGLEFTNSCTPGVPLYTYCNDLDHTLYQDPYCVDIEDVVVDPVYPEQSTSLAYIQSWFVVDDAQDDRIMQLATWKLADDQNSSHSTYGQPFYSFDAGRGYPSIGETPAYPYVNTVYNDDASINDPANALLLDALGITDGIQKNVAMCAKGDLTSDQLTAANAAPVINGGTIEVTVTFTLVRGTHAISVGNTSVSGVKLLPLVDVGSLSSSEIFTDAAGQASVVLSRPYGSEGFGDSHITACTYGAWPVSVTPCEDGGQQQQQQQQGGELCSLCVDLTVPGDNFLSAELTSFTAVAQNNTIVLNWQTASENNSASWEIQRSFSGSGNFARIANLPASNSPTGSRYNYTDRTAQAGYVYDYRLVDIDINGERNIHNMIRSAGFTANGGGIIAEYNLADNFPNPFNPETNIRFTLSEKGLTNLKVYNAMGLEVAQLINSELSSGEHSVKFNAAALPSGIYFYKLSSGNFSMTKKMVLMK